MERCVQICPIYDLFYMYIFEKYSNKAEESQRLEDNEVHTEIAAGL